MKTERWILRTLKFKRRLVEDFGAFGVGVETKRQGTTRDDEFEMHRGMTKVDNATLSCESFSEDEYEHNN